MCNKNYSFIPIAVLGALKCIMYYTFLCLVLL